MILVDALFITLIFVIGFITLSITAILAAECTLVAWRGLKELFRAMLATLRELRFAMFGIEPKRFVPLQSSISQLRPAREARSLATDLREAQEYHNTRKRDVNAPMLVYHEIGNSRAYEARMSRRVSLEEAAARHGLFPEALRAYESEQEMGREVYGNERG